MPKLRRCAVEFRATPARRAREVWSEEGGYKSVAIGHTVDKTSLNSLMVVTVEKIEKETNYRALRKWKEPHPQEEAVGYFIAKVDVWELEIEQLQKRLPAMRRLLGRSVLASIRYTTLKTFVSFWTCRRWRSIWWTHTDFPAKEPLLFPIAAGAFCTIRPALATTFTPPSKCASDAQRRPNSTTKLSRS